MRIIYGSVLSPYVRKVLIALQLKNIDYDFQELHPLVPAHKQKLLQLNPLGKIPVYQEDDFVIPDSSVICAYLDKRYPQPSIIPNELHLYAKILWLEEYSDTELTPTIITIFINALTKPKMNIPPDNQALTQALKIKLPEIFDYLNGEISDNQYFYGDQLSIVDISILSALMSYNILGYDIDEHRWGHLAHYVDIGLKAKPVHHVFMQTQKKIQEKYGVTA